jgi:hypothetical protein
MSLEICSGRFRPKRAEPGRFWPGFGRNRENSARSGRVFSKRAKPGPIWPGFSRKGPNRARSGRVFPEKGQTRPNSAGFRLWARIWAKSVQFGPNIEFFGPIKAQLDLDNLFWHKFGLYMPSFVRF